MEASTTKYIGAHFSHYVTWPLVILALTSGLVLNHESVRLLPLFAGHPWLGPICSVALVGAAVAVVAAIAFAKAASRGLKRLRIFLFGCVAAVALLVTGISSVNFIGAHRASRLPVASFSSDDSAHVLRVRGRIDALFPSRLEDSIKGKRVDVLEIDSLGGDVAAAEASGKLLDGMGIAVRIHGRCASACVLLWAAASRREIVAGSQVGLHRSHLGDGKEAEGLVDAALQRRQEHSTQILTAAGFSPELVRSAIERPPNQVLWLSAADLQREGVRMAIVQIPRAVESNDARVAN